MGEIIRPRIEEIFELLLRRLEDSGFAAAAGQRIMLAGGAAQLPGMVEYVSTVFGKAVRMGKPLGIIGLADATRGPAFSAATGLLRFASVEQEFEPRRETERHQKGRHVRQVMDWFNNHI